MKKINVYVVTYNNKENINLNAKRFFDSIHNLDTNKYEINYHIINNHSNFHLESEYSSKTTVFHNYLRPDWSCGHLARDYNAALMHGFKNLKNPAIEQVVCAHDDSLWHSDWLPRLEKIHEKYSFYSGDFGCSLTSYLPEAIRKIGIWDERFCNIGYHEADYFLRALLFNKNKSSINDYLGGRLLNPTEVIFDHMYENINKKIHCEGSLPYHTVSRKVFEKKWNVHPEFWDTRLFKGSIPSKPLIDTYMMYPYFELDIEDLESKNYCYAMAGLENFKNEWR